MRARLTGTDVWAIAAQLLDIAGAPGELRFVDDEQLRFAGDQIHVQAADTFTVDDASRWDVFLDPCPVWLHINVLPAVDGQLIASLRRSGASAADADDPRAPRVDVSRTIGFDEPLPGSLDASSRRRVVLHTD